MNILFVHQNAPAQYRHLALHFAAQKKHTIHYLTQQHGGSLTGVSMIRYQPEPRSGTGYHGYTLQIDDAVRAGLGAADACRQLRSKGVTPDIVIGHAGWGETMFLKDVFPDTPILANFEFYYRHEGSDFDFDPEYTSIFGEPALLRTRNAVSLMALDSADWGHSATGWQKSLFPREWQSKITAIHEGVDTDIVRPYPEARLRLAGTRTTLTSADEVITFVARNLEPYRGFHVFMRALPELLKRRPKAHVVIAGGDGVSYGATPPPGLTYRDLLMREVGDRLDMSRVHLVGTVPYTTFLQILQVSSAHVYLTYPFVLSWSLTEALAAGCMIVGSRTPPVEEFLHHEQNALLVDFFDGEELVSAIERGIKDRKLARALRKNARETAVSVFDLKRRQIPQWEKVIADLIAGRRPRLDCYRAKV